MDDSAVKTLFLPLASGEVDAGEAGARWLFLNAAVPPLDCGLRRGQIAAVQGMRPLFNALDAAGLTVTPDLPDGQFDGALILISRHRDETRSLINKALSRLKPGGAVLIAGSKNDGIASAAKDAGALFDISGSLSKYHAKVFWFRADGSKRLPEAEPGLIGGRYRTAPGLFSSAHVDPGSAFLISQLPRDLKGRIADFCAGWGYLSAEIAAARPAVKSIALHEADHAALEAAKANMACLASGMAASFHWQDLMAEKATGSYDTVVMNPPFHQGRSADPAIGSAIIRNARNALHKGGRLYLVANRNLPYEAVLAAEFFKSGELARNAGYKVLWAVK